MHILLLDIDLHAQTTCFIAVAKGLLPTFTTCAMKIHYMGAVSILSETPAEINAQELSGRDADVNVVSNQQMQLTMAAAGRIPVEQCR